LSASPPTRDLTKSLPSFVLVAGSARSAPAEEVACCWLPQADSEDVFAAGGYWSSPEPLRPDDVDQLVDWLDEAIIEPLLRLAGRPRRLVVIPGGMAAYLPLPAAVGPDRRGRPA
jgi:hypothetical protein